jgi:two-component system, cell cycle sensor histidine kinase and response regulator CckA
MSAGTVLVVEDNPISRRIVRLALESTGYDVVEADDRAQALDAAAACPPDLIITRDVLRDADGLALANEIRRRVDAPLAAIILSKAWAGLEETRARAVRSTQFLASPTEPSRLLEVVRAYLPAPEEAPPQLPTAALQCFALTLLERLSETLVQPQAALGIVDESLRHCLDAAGIATGLLYLVDPVACRLEAQCGIPAGSRAEAAACFGAEHSLRRLAEADQPAAFSAGSLSADDEPSQFLSRLGHASALMAPFVVPGQGRGVLILASDTQDLSEQAWVSFAGRLAAQLGQALVFRDVTGLRGAERRPPDSDTHYRLLFEHNPHAMWVFDAETLGFLAVNETAVRHYGYSRERFLAMTVNDIRQSDRSSAEAPGSWKHRKSDGSIIEVEEGLTLLTFQERRAWLTLATDVTDKKQVEARLLRSQKMESIGRLAGGVAHDFNNLLGVITGYGELLRKRLPADLRLEKYVDDMLKAAERGAGLTRQLLAFSRKQVLHPRILDLNSVVVEMEPMLRRVIGEHIQLGTVLDERLAALRADAGQLEQVLVHLAANARDAMPQGGHLIIETSDVQLDAKDAAAHPEIEPGRYVVLAMSDTGEGMPPEVKNHVFEPFFTTKGPGKGTGLGLATVHGIVRQSGGHIFVYSEPGRGTTFKVYLPAAGEPALVAALRREDEEDHFPTGIETILVAEDELSLRELVCEELVALGYTVLQASHGGAAGELCAHYNGSIDLLVTDVALPGIGGQDLAKTLAALRPDMKVLYVSAYTDDAVILRGLLTDEMPFLQKPFTSGALARKVREVLDG